MRSMTTSKPPEGADRATPRRGRRRATVAGTGPASADGPEPRLDEVDPGMKKPAAKLSARDRAIMDEKPPHY